MWLFLIILIFLGFWHTAINISLLKKTAVIAVLSFLLSAVGFVFFPFAIKINIHTLSQFLNNVHVLSCFCTYQIIESITFMLLSLLLIRQHYLGKQKLISSFFYLLPSGIFLAGIFFLQTFLFNSIEYISFFSITLVLFVGAYLLLFLNALALKKIFLNWEWRMELKIILSFFQILIAMFLPIIVMGVKIHNTQLNFNIKSSFISLTVMLLVAYTGYFYKMKKTGGLKG